MKSFNTTVATLLTGLLVTGVAVTAPEAARAARPEIEVSMGPGFLSATAASASTTLSAQTQGLLRLDVGLSLTPAFDLRLGATYLDDQTTTLLGDLSQEVGLATIALGVKAAYALLDRARWTVQIVGLLDIEAVHSWRTVRPGGGVGELSQAVWGFGLQPQAGFEVLYSPDVDGGYALVLRVISGFAWRLDTDYDALAAGPAQPGVQAMDLGTTNFSGVTASAQLGVRF